MQPRLIFVLPQNFAFLKRLPVKFSAFVIKEHPMVQGLRVYELKINDAVLKLRSEVLLPVGEKIQIQKTQDSSKLKIISKTEPEPVEFITKKNVESTNNEMTTTLMSSWQKVFTSLGLAILKDQKQSPVFTVGENKYSFELAGDVFLKGVFISAQNLGAQIYDLYLFSPDAKADDTEKLGLLLKEFGVRKFHFVSLETIEALSKGVQAIV